MQPFGDVRANWHAAMIAHIIALAHTSPKHRPPSLDDFMFKDAETRQEEADATALAWFRSMKRG